MAPPSVVTLSVMVLPTMQEAKSGIDTAHVSFEQVGGQHFLSTIETADHLFTIPVSQVEILQAAAKPHSGASGSGSSAGGN
jgi:hypothetical protein